MGPAIKSHEKFLLVYICCCHSSQFKSIEIASFDWGRVLVHLPANAGSQDPIGSKISCKISCSGIRMGSVIQYWEKVKDPDPEDSDPTEFKFWSGSVDPRSEIFFLEIRIRDPDPIFTGSLIRSVGSLGSVGSIRIPDKWDPRILGSDHHWKIGIQRK